MKLRGIALITVLLAASVLTVLCTSLVIVSRTSLFSGEQYRRREVLLQSCYSGLDYARARLTQDSSWGLAGFGNNLALNDNRLRVVENGSDELSNRVQGAFLPSGASFEVRVYNRLRGLAASSPPVWSVTRVRVPPRCAMVQVEAQYEGATRKLEVVLTRNHVITNAIHAGRDFAANVPANSSGMRFSSALPRGNLLAAARDVYLPDTSTVHFAGRNGTVRAGQEVAVNSTVTFDGQGGFTPRTLPSAPVRLHGNPAAQADATTRMQAQIRMGSTSNSAFHPDKLRQPTEARQQLDPGTYTFTGPDTVVYRDASGNTVSYSGNILGKVFLQDFRFIPQGNIEVPGNLTVNGMVRRAIWVQETDGPGYIGAAEPAPTLVSLGLGYNPEGVPLPSNSHQDRLTVLGNLTVEGDLVGHGQIFVKRPPTGGGGVLDVAGNSFLSSTRTDGMAVVTEQLARFREVSSGFTAMPAFMFPNDIRHFKSAVSSECASTPASRATLDNFRTADVADRLDMVGSQDGYGLPGLRNQPADNGSVTLADFQALTDIPLDRYRVTLNRDPAPPITQMADATISNYVREMTRVAGGGTRPLTLGQYLRLREFVKSLNFGVPRSDLIDTGNALYASAENNRFVATQILNQVQAYDQDARNAGQSLTAYLSGVNPTNYAGRLAEMIYGGLLYSDGDIFTAVTNNFNLFGGMLSLGNIGFDHLQSGNIVYDPAMLEDQFDLSRLGLTPLFFWIN